MSQNIKMQKRGPNETPWQPDFTYDCSSGHEIHSDQPVSQCPAYDKGSPCRGTLKRWGKGAGKGAKR